MIPLRLVEQVFKPSSLGVESCISKCVTLGRVKIKCLVHNLSVVLVEVVLVATEVLMGVVVLLVPGVLPAVTVLLVQVGFVRLFYFTVRGISYLTIGRGGFVGMSPLRSNFLLPFNLHLPSVLPFFIVIIVETGGRGVHLPVEIH